MTTIEAGGERYELDYRSRDDGEPYYELVIRTVDELSDGGYTYRRTLGAGSRRDLTTEFVESALERFHHEYPDAEIQFFSVHETFVARKGGSL